MSKYFGLTVCLLFIDTQGHRECNYVTITTQFHFLVTV